MDAYQVTKQDIAALRTCDRIVLYYHRTDDTATITAMKDRDDRNPWDQQHRIPVTASAQCYQEGYVVNSASSVVSNYTWTECPATDLIAVLKPGDDIALVFTAGNDNGYLKEAHLHHDTLDVLVIRNGKRVVKIRMDESICPDNTARMCKVEPYAYAQTA